MPTHPFLLTAVALTATAAAQTGWVQRFPATQPPARGYHAMTFDLVRGKTVMFGGSNGLPLADTWEWDGLDWTPRLTANAPSARSCSAIAADLNRGRVVLFGGIGSLVMNDTWEFDGNNWTQMQPANQPSARRDVRMEHDLARARTVLFGGFNNSGALADTWEWNGVNWAQRNPATSPPPRCAQGMAYDFARSRIVLCGGRGLASPLLSDTWTWDGTTWTQLLQAGPPGVLWPSLANDPARDLVVWFGGLAAGAQTWLLDHVSWRRDPRGAAPASWTGCSFAHDWPRGRTVLFGGATPGPSPYLSDTWEYDPGTIARWTTYGSGCQGTSSVSVLGPVGASLPIVGTTFQLELLGIPGNAAAISIGFSNTQWNGNTLPWNLGAIGMTGCTLHVSPDFLFFAPVIAGRATLAWQLPNAPGLIGTRFFDQGFALDPTANPLGAIVSNAGSGIVGPF